MAFVAVNFTQAVFRSLLLLAIMFNLTLPQPFFDETVSTESFETNDNLQSATDALLPLFDNMPRVPVYLKDEPMLKTGTNVERGAAYTHCFRNESPAIFMKKVFYQKANRLQLVNALKHELTHAWLCRQQLMSVGHGAAFREKFTQVGGVGN
jgi:hypothetical protein